MLIFKRPPKPHVMQMGPRRFVTHGLSRHFWSDIYHRALSVRWYTFFGLVGAAFLVLNALFALLYLIGDHAIANQLPQGFAGAFFFSVETLSTVGYGDMHPQTLYAHLVATFEIFTGMGSIALVTGLIFSRFSRPHAKIIFANYPVIRTVEGQPTLMIRAANARQNVIVAASAKLHMLRLYRSPEGFQLRKILDLTLVRDQQPMFFLSWTLMHVIDQNSPLFGETTESLMATDAILMLSIEGIDESTSQSMQARQQWSHGDLRWNYGYADLVTSSEKDMLVLDYRLFHDIQPLEETKVDEDAATTAQIIADAERRTLVP